MSIPALDGTVECNDFCVLIFLILIEKKKKKKKKKKRFHGALGSGGNLSAMSLPTERASP